jgi:glycosyltransferase involved in cell wall biosynthesis
MRVVVVDLVATSPFYCRPFTLSLRERGARAELASPVFYLEPGYVEASPRPSWLVDLVARRPRPRSLRLGLRAAEVTLNSLGLTSAILRGAYDVVHVQWIPVDQATSPFLSTLRLACRAGGALLALTVHNPVPHDRPRADRLKLGEAYSHASLLFAHSPLVASELREEHRVKAPVAVVPHGPLFADMYLPPSPKIAAELGWGAGPVVLYFGIVRPYKGLDLLLSAWPAVRRALPWATLVVVGRALGAVGARQLAHVKRLDGVQVVDRYVSLEEMARYHAASDLVVFPYRRIAQSGAFMTAVALGRPTVITPIAGLVDQSTGLSSVVVAQGMSPRALTEAILQGLSRPGELEAAAAADRRALINSERGWAAIAARTLEAYRKAIDSPGRASEGGGSP